MAVDASSGDSGQRGSVQAEATPEARTAQQRPVEAEATPEVKGILAGDPLALGLPSFIVGSVALGMVLIGFVPATAVGASLPIIMAATAAGLFISTFWAAAVGQSAVALVLGVFAGFWFSYSILILGLAHNWFGIGLLAVTSTVELFLTAWLVIMAMLTLATLRLASAFTAVLGLVSVALMLILIGTIQASPNLIKAGGATAFLFAVVGIYIFFGTASIATGGKAMPLGKPILKS
jgi:succinate-acetate transporter protein